jgi:peptidoglycan DL-endopeptidase CwlO
LATSGDRNLAIDTFPVATTTTPSAAAGGSSAGVKALVFARAAIGKPYRYGAAGPNAFDCSGLVMSAFKKAGVRLPRTSAAQSRAGTAVRRDQLQPGDLLFFYTPVSHVGIYLGKGKMVHASTSGQPVKISRIGGRPLHNARRI